MADPDLLRLPTEESPSDNAEEAWSMSWRLAIEDAAHRAMRAGPTCRSTMLCRARLWGLTYLHLPTSAGASGGWRGALKHPDAGRWITAGYTDVAVQPVPPHLPVSTVSGASP